MYYNSGSPSLLAEKMDTYMFYLFKMSRVRRVITTKSSKDEKRERKKKKVVLLPNAKRVKGKES